MTECKCEYFLYSGPGTYKKRSWYRVYILLHRAKDCLLWKHEIEYLFFGNSLLSPISKRKVKLLLHEVCWESDLGWRDISFVSTAFRERWKDFEISFCVATEKRKYHFAVNFVHKRKNDENWPVEISLKFFFCISLFFSLFFLLLFSFCVDQWNFRGSVSALLLLVQWMLRTDPMFPCLEGENSPVCRFAGAATQPKLLKIFLANEFDFFKWLGSSLSPEICFVFAALTRTARAKHTFLPVLISAQMCNVPAVFTWMPWKCRKISLLQLGSEPNSSSALHFLGFVFIKSPVLNHSTNAPLPNSNSQVSFYFFECL